MSWLWRIIAAAITFVLASVTAYLDRSLGDAVGYFWRLLGAGLVAVAGLLSLVLLISGLVVLADSRAAQRG